VTGVAKNYRTILGEAASNWRLRVTSRIAVVCLAFFGITGGDDAFAQDAAAPAAPTAGAVRIFLDCNNVPCDTDFFRTELSFVEHVRDRQTADIHLLMTGQSTGSGGREITFSFFGQGRFMGRDQVLKETFVVAASEDDVRRGMVRMMSLGLVNYVLGLPGAERLRVTVQPPPSTTAPALQSRDSWNRWSFRVNLNGNANGESSSKSFYLNTNVSANRVTDESKINLNSSVNYRESKFELPDGRTFLSPNRDFGINGLYVKSLGGHWSAGIRSNWNSSTFNNQDWSWSGGPAIEWDLFPYSESTRRILTFNYSVRSRIWDYREETIYGKLHEERIQQSLETQMSMRQRWGTLGASVDVASFVPDVAKNHVSGYGDISLNLFRGLSLNLSSNVEWVRDQISLPAEEATSEEVLVNQRQLATSYRYYLYFGVSYSFGSIFSPIVNPRFGG
jgi:hypothetical protein